MEFLNSIYIAAKKDYLQDTNVELLSETHGGEDVGIWSRGPMSHLFHANHEQSYIGHVMMYASCVGPNQDHCKGEKIPPDCPTGGATGAASTNNVKTMVYLLIIYIIYPLSNSCECMYL